MNKERADKATQELVEGLTSTQPVCDKRKFEVVISTAAKPNEKTVFTILPQFKDTSPTFGISIDGVTMVGMFSLEHEDGNINITGMINKGTAEELCELDLAEIAKVVAEKFPAWHRAAFPELYPEDKI